MILQNVNLENVYLVGETVDVFVAILSQWIGYASHENVHLLPLDKVIAELASFLSNQQYHL